MRILRRHSLCFVVTAALVARSFSAPSAAGGYELKVTADRADQVYRRGDTVTFTIALLREGKPVAGLAAKWSITKDGVPQSRTCHTPRCRCLQTHGATRRARLPPLHGRVHAARHAEAHGARRRRDRATGDQAAVTSRGARVANRPSGFIGRARFSGRKPIRMVLRPADRRAGLRWCASI